MVYSIRTTVRRHLLMILLIMAIAPLTSANAKRCKRLNPDRVNELSLTDTIWELELTGRRIEIDWSDSVLHIVREQVYGDTRLLEGYVTWQGDAINRGQEYLEGSLDTLTGQLELKGIYSDTSRTRGTATMTALICRDLQRFGKGRWQGINESALRWQATLRE